MRLPRFSALKITFTKRLYPKKAMSIGYSCVPADFQPAPMRGHAWQVVDASIYGCPSVLTKFWLRMVSNDKKMANIVVRFDGHLDELGQRQFYDRCAIHFQVRNGHRD